MAFKVACLQIEPLANIDAATSHAETLAKRAADEGADVICLPEYSGGLRTDAARFAPPAFSEEAHPFLQHMRQIARQTKSQVMLGSIAITDEQNAAREARYFNRSFVIDPQGAIIARYDKIHLFDIQLDEGAVYRESDTVTAGNQAVTVPTSFGCFGLSICYDLRFGALYRSLAQAGAQILMVPAAFTKVTGEAHWHVLNRARAIENACYVIAPCQIGAVSGGGECFGHSLIIDPWGRVLADGGTVPGIILGDIDLDAVAESRGKIPVLAHQRDFQPPTPPLREAVG